MDDIFKWRFEQTGSSRVVVADNLPGYRAEIKAVIPVKGQRILIWTVYEQQQMIAAALRPVQL